MWTAMCSAVTAMDPERIALGECPVLGRERWEEVRRVAATERLKISALARRFDLDRKTVRRCLRQTTWQPYQRPVRTDTLLAEHLEYLRERAPAVQYSARVLYQELRQAHGYAGSYDTVKRFVQPLRAVRLQAERALVRFETPPGQQSQSDWGQAHVYFPPPAGRAACVRVDARLQPPQLLSPVPARGAPRVARQPRAGLRALRRPYARAPLRSAANGMPRWGREQDRLESHLPGLRGVLELRAAGLPAVPRADQGQGRGGGEVLPPQFPPGAELRRLRGLRRAARAVDGRDRRRAPPRDHS